MSTNRKNTTLFLSQILVSSKLAGKYWASEVVLDYGLKHPKRIDFVEFVPKNQISISGLEKGEIVCYEVKSCKEDFTSGNGLNFEGEKNYIVTTMQCYKEIVHDIPYHVGVYVAVPNNKSDVDEFKEPTELPDLSNLDENQCSMAISEWHITCIKCSHPKDRERSLIEFLFSMMRAKNTNRYL